nr:hypothetical protein TDPV-371 [Oriental turtle dovepox virus]
MKFYTLEHFTILYHNVNTIVYSSLGFITGISLYY